MGECFLYRRGGGSGGGSPVLPEVEKTVFGRSLVLTDSTSKPLKGLRLFGRTTQNGTPSPDNPVPLVSPGDGGSITVEMGASNGVQNIQRLVCNTPNGLPGIPVSSGGNMADENGQQWICDEIDFERGVYIQRVFEPKLPSNTYASIDTAWYDPEKTYCYEFDFVDGNGIALGDKSWGLCSHLKSYDFSEFYYKKIETGFMASQHYCIFNFSKSLGICKTLDEFKQWWSDNNVKLYKPREDVIETDLTAEELAQYAALHTNSLYTTISNTAGADMEVTYAAIGG